MKKTASILVTVVFLFDFTQAFENSAVDTCSVEKRTCEIQEDNLISSISAIEVEECRQLCFDLDYCKYFSHFGLNNYPISNYCMLFSSCPVLENCEDCYTEDKLCYGSCGRNLESKLADNVIEFIQDVRLEHSCKTLCLDNAKCKYYTNFGKDDPDDVYPDLCVLMTDIKAPFQECDHCVTSVPDCKNNSYACKFTINDENTLYDSYLFNSSTTAKFPLASNLACQATFVAIGGGGTKASRNYGGGGSGYVETVVIDISSTEYDVTVGTTSNGGDSYVKNNAGEKIMNALQGGNSYSYHGGLGYSGGGDRSSKGGSNGSDGEGENGGSGTGTDVSEISLNHFFLSPGDGGEPNGGGGGGILVDNFGPAPNDNTGKGYGGGGGGGYYGNPGMV